jgi:hypothetical protein
MQPVIHHVGYVVENLPAAIEQWTRDFAAGPFQTLAHIEFDEVTYEGAPAVYDHSSAFGPNARLSHRSQRPGPRGLAARRPVRPPGRGVAAGAGASRLLREPARLNAARIWLDTYQQSVYSCSCWTLMSG